MEAAGLEEHDADAEEEEGAMQRTETAAKAMMLTPDPFHGAPALLSSGKSPQKCRTPEQGAIAAGMGHWLLLLLLPCRQVQVG
jgi:hypothetical protein